MNLLPPKRISGRDNSEFKRFLAVRTRKNRDLVLVEGPRLLGEVIRSRLPLDAVAFDERGADLHGAGVDARVRLIFSAALMAGLADVETHQGVVALVERPRFPRDWLAEEDAFILVLDGLQDPGNVGTLFRTAEASGVSGVLLTRGCADPLSPKALRASAGSAFRLPHVLDLSADEALSLLPHGVPLVAAVADPEAKSLFGEEGLGLPLVLALGSEGSGLSERLEQAATARFRVPVAARVESLNVAAAGAVMMFEIARRAGRLK